MDELIYYRNRAEMNEGIKRLRKDPDVISVTWESPDPVVRVVRREGAQEQAPETPEGPETPETPSEPESGHAETPETPSEPESGHAETPETPEEPEAEEETPEEPEAEEETPEEPEAEEETPEEPEAEEGIILETATRAQLREIVADYALDIEIPDNGPLAPLRAIVGAALAETDPE